VGRNRFARCTCANRIAPKGGGRRCRSTVQYAASAERGYCALQSLRVAGYAGLANGSRRLGQAPAQTQRTFVPILPLFAVCGRIRTCAAEIPFGDKRVLGLRWRLTQPTSGTLSLPPWRRGRGVLRRRAEGTGAEARRNTTGVQIRSIAPYKFFVLRATRYRKASAFYHRKACRVRPLVTPALACILTQWLRQSKINSVK